MRRHRRAAEHQQTMMVEVLVVARRAEALEIFRRRVGMKGSWMHALKKYMGSSIGRKQMMGATGMVLYGYLFVHLVGNLGMLTGAEKYNKYGYLLLHELAEIIVPVEKRDRALVCLGVAAHI